MNELDRDKFIKGLDAVSNRLMTMPIEQYLKEIEKFKDGDIAKALLYSGALDWPPKPPFSNS